MRRSRVRHTKPARLLEHGVAGATARMAAALVGVNRRTAAYDFLVCEQFAGVVEGDERNFGGRCNGYRGRGAAGTGPVFGLLTHGGRIYAKVIPNSRGRMT